MRGRAVLVTGGGSGIGRAAAQLLAGLGARVGVLDIDEASASEVAKEARDRGAERAVAVRCDVSVEDDVVAALIRCHDELGPPHGLFANAGTDAGAPLHELPTGTWERLIRTNLTGTYLTCKHVIARMLARGAGGSIVCTSSPAAFVAFAAGGAGGYSASKGGISALVRCMAIDYASHGIRVNAIVPGPTDTKLMWVNVPEEARPRMREVIQREVPLGRLAEPQEVARAAVWLLSDDASYVTGSHIVIDGGVTAKASISV
jgi:NAD(P)-dependent dehydrogenase (short-subunit alcohol dehydrogenase family)